MIFDLFKNKTKIYKYRGLNGSKYPVCEVTFLFDKKERKPYKTFMIVDSGADISIVPKTIGEDLNLKKTDLHYLGGIGGKLGYYINYVNVQIADKKLTIPIAWTTTDNTPLLLGRKDVFNKFKICFIEKKEVVKFTII